MGSEYSDPTKPKRVRLLLVLLRMAVAVLVDAHFVSSRITCRERIRPRRDACVALTGAKTVETATVEQLPKLLIKTVQLYKGTGAETHRDVCRQSTQIITLG